MSSSVTIGLWSVMLVLTVKHVIADFCPAEFLDGDRQRPENRLGAAAARALSGGISPGAGVS